MAKWDRMKHWLHRNDFFERTPLNGWAYIYAANGIGEIVFWYAVILTLSGLTIYNVHQVTKYYLSDPVQFKVYTQASTDDIEIPDLTLTLNMVYFDWQERLPLKVRLKKVPSHVKWYFSPGESDRFSIFRDFLCDTNTEETDLKYLLNMNNNMLGEASLQHFYGSLGLNRSATLVDFSDPTILLKWRAEMEIAKNEYYQYWIKALTTPIEQQNRALIGNRLRELQDSQITRRPVDALIKLLTLKAIESGDESFVAKLGFPKDHSIQKLNATPAQLVRDMVSELSQLVHFETKPQSSVSLLDWNHLEDGAKNLQLTYYLRSSMWLKHILQALEAVVDTVLIPQMTKKDGKKKLTCGNASRFTKTLKELVWMIWEEWDFAYLFDRIIVSEPLSGWHVNAYPTSSNYISLVPQTVFQSKVQGCYNKSIDLCNRQCIGSRSVHKCSCLPWNLADLLDSSDWPSKQICDRQCLYAEIVLQCSKECGEKIEESCQVVQTRVKGELTQVYDSAIEIHQKMDINVSVQELYPHAKLLKEYELTNSGYLSLLGGAIEFWSAMDVLGLIHLLLFTIFGLYSIVFKVGQSNVTDVVHDGTMSLESIEQKYTTAIERLSHGQKSRLKVLANWLKGNKFYEETPFTGYSYINAVESVIEIGLWYGIISLFVALAIYNVNNNIGDYISRSTKVNIVPRTMSTHLPNVTLKMVLPIIMLTEYNARVHYDITKEQSSDDLYNTAANMILQETSLDFPILSQQLVSQWLNQTLSASLTDLLHFNKSQKSSTLSGGDVFDQSLNLSRSSFIDWMFRANSLTWTEIQLKSPELFSGPRTGVDGLIFKLLLLRSIKTGEPTFKQLGGDGPQAVEILEQLGCTTEQLYDHVMWQLGHVLHVRGAHARIIDIEFDEEYLNRDSFALEIELALPTDSTSTHIEVDSLLFRWVQEIHGHDRTWQDTNEFDFITNEIFVYNFFTFARDSLEYCRWFDNLTYAILTAPTADMPIITSLFANGFANQNLHEYALVTQWTYHSEKNSCPDVQQEECVKNCVLEEYVSLCDCVPWSVMEPNRWHRLCNEPCKIDTNKCVTKCRGYFCDRQARRFAVSIFKPSEQNKLNVFDFKLSTIENLHMHFLETYEYSLGTFLAQIGGVLEFWLGCNVIAVLHCLAYLFKYIQYISRSGKKENIDRTQVLNRLERRLKRISSLVARLRIDIKEARKAAKSGTLRERNEHSVHWLYKNKFYETTSITGFKFIAHARSGQERVFWAALILLFFCITIYNVYTTIDYYGQKPTVVSTKVSHANQLELRNFTLSFEANLVEWSQRFPTELQRTGKSSNSITDHFACELTNIDTTTNYNTERFKLLEEKLNFDQWTLKREDWPINQPIQSSDQILQNWTEFFEEGSAALSEFWERYKSSPLLVNIDQFNDELMQLLDAPLMQRNLSFSHGFFLLEAFNTGARPQAKLLKLLSKARRHNYDIQPTGETIDELLGDVNANDFVKLMEQELSKMILIRVVDEPDAEISLQSWSYEPSGGLDDLLGQMLEYHIILPPNPLRTQVHIETYSFLRLWHKYIFESLLKHFENNNRVSEKFLCKSAWHDIKSLIDHENYLFEVLLMNPTLVPHHMEVWTENLDFVLADEWQSTEILVHLTGALHSNTYNCSSLSPQQCLDRCHQRHSMAVCRCQPWGLLYLNQFGPVCTAPCRPPAHCSEECERLIQNQCHYAHSRLERTEYYVRNPDIYATSLDTAQHDVVIKTKVASYISHSESYETVGSFVAQLGSILDLWLGINLLSIIHLMVFLLKQLFRKIACGSKNTITSSDPSLLVRIQLMEKRIGKNLGAIRKDIKVKIMRIKEQEARQATKKY